MRYLILLPLPVLAWAQSIALENPVARLAVDPGIGGRAVSYRAAGREWLWKGTETVPRDPTPEKPWDYAQLGGFHLWPAPQARWKGDGSAWPPPPRIDHGAYETLPGAADEIALRSPLEQTPGWSFTGIRAELRYQLVPSSTRMRLTSTFVNHGGWPQWWSHWHITTVRLPLPIAGAPRGYASFPVRAASAAGAQGFLLQAGPVAAERSGMVVRLPYTGAQWKISADSDGGWLAAEDREIGAVLVQRFTANLKRAFGTWPEGQSTLAVFSNEMAGFTELELMGPQQEIVPGASTSFTAEWAACRVDGPLVSAGEAGATVRPLVLADGRATGSFGVFDAGIAELVVDGALVWKGACSPDAPLVLDAPVGGTAVELRVAGRVLAAVSPPAASPAR